MNRVFKKVWNGLRQSVVVVSEASSSQAGKSRANVGTVSAKTGVMAAVSAAIALGSMQAGAETALQMDALSSSDTVEVVSIPTNVDEANGATSAVYVDTVLQNTAAESTKTALLFASEDYSNEFLKETNRITQSMGFKGIQGVSGGVEVADGKHLVLVGEDSTVDGAADFAILDGDLIVHGNADGIGDSIVTLGSYGTLNKTTGTLKNIYVAINPSAVEKPSSSGVLRVRHGDFKAGTLYNGYKVFIGGNGEEGMREDSDVSLTVAKFVGNGTSVLNNYGTFTVGELTTGNNNLGAVINNYKTMSIETGNFTGYIYNRAGELTGQSLTLTAGANYAEDGEGLKLGNTSTNYEGATMTLGSLTLAGMTQWSDNGSERAGGLRNHGVLTVTGDMDVGGVFENLAQTSVGTLNLNGEGKVINNGTLTASGTVTINKNASFEGTGTLEADQVKVSPDDSLDVVATLIQDQLKVTGDSGVLNNGTIRVNSLETTKVSNNNGQLEVGSATVTGVLENRSDVTISEKADIDQLIQRSGGIQGEGVHLSADDVTVTDGTINVGTLDVSGSMAVDGGSVEADVWKLGNETSISGGTINVKDIQSQGSTINFTGNNWVFAEGSDWFDGATINFNNGVDYTMKEMGDGNNLYVQAGGTLRIDELNNDSQVFVGQGGTLVAGTVNDSTVSMLGGTLQTSLDQLFTFETEGGDQPVDAEGNPYDEILFGGNTVITGVRDEIKGWNQQLNGSLQLSGDYVLGQNIGQITDVLQENGFTTTNTQLVLTGANKGQEANITTIKELLASGKYEAGLILANTSFENRVATDQDYETKAEFDSSYGGNSFGFKDIVGAAEAEVSGGNHLTLVGASDVENYKDAHLLDPSQGSETSITIKGGQISSSLTLGLSGGTATKGWIDKITDNSDGDEVGLTVQNGEFGTGTLATGNMHVASNATFHVENKAEIKGNSIVDGHLDVQNGTIDVSLGKLTNNGTVDVNDLQLQNQGQGIENIGALSANTVTAGADITNKGSLTVKDSLSITLGHFVNDSGDKVLSVGELQLTGSGDKEAAFVQKSGQVEVGTMDANHHWAMEGGSMQVDTYKGAIGISMTDGVLSIGDYQAKSPIEVQGGQLTIDKKADQAVMVTGTDEKEAIFQLNAQDPMTGHLAVSGNSQMIFGDNTDIAGVPETGTRVVFSQKTTLADGATLNVGSTTKAVVDATFGKDSVTVVDAGALGLDNAAFVAGGSDQSLKVEEGAQLIIGNAKDQGNYVVTEGFDLTDNFDSEGNWIGGWAEGVKVLSQAGTGLGFDIEFNTNKDDGSIYITTVLNDVSVLYPNIGIQSIANAAVRAEGEMAAGLSFVKDILSSDALTVNEKTNVVNSVSEIGLASGSMAVALNDVETVTDSIVNRLSLAEEPSKANGLWVDMLYSSQEADDMKADGHMKYGFETDSYGFIMGYDHQVANSNVRLGAAFSYQKGDLDSTGDVLKTTNDYNTFGFHGYGVWQPTDRINVLGSVSYLRSSSDVEQQLGVAGHNKATADIDTNVITAGARVEGVFPVAQGVTVVPHIGARVIHADSGSYGTKIDGTKAFDNDADAATLFQMPIGVAVRMDKTLDNGWTVRPHADLTVIPQFGDTEQDIKVKTGAFTDTVSGDVAGDFATKATFGVQATKDNTTVGARYGFTAGDMGRQDHAFKVEVRYAF